MFYRGVQRAQIKGLRNLLARILTRDDLQQAKPAGKAATKIVVTGDDTTRSGFEELLSACNVALDLK